MNMETAELSIPATDGAGPMENWALFVLGDGVLAKCALPEGTSIQTDGVCILDINDTSEFGRFAGNCGPGRQMCHAYLTGSFSNLAPEADLEKLAGNEEAVKRARAVFMKWADENQRRIQSLRMRFSVRREALFIHVGCPEFVDLRPVVEMLEKRFQTKTRLRMMSPRDIAGAIGGTGHCGQTLCCSTGVCGRTSVDVRMAKQQPGSPYDFAASGVCGKLKCCICYEAQSAMPEANSSARTE